MLQRIQTVYLIIAAISAAGLIFLFPLWEIQQEEYGLCYKIIC